MYSGSTANMIQKQAGSVWQISCKPGKEEEGKQQAIIVSISYNLGKPIVRYFSDESLFDGSVSVIAILADYYIGFLGGVKR